MFEGPATLTAGINKGEEQVLQNVWVSSRGMSAGRFPVNVLKYKPHFTPRTQEDENARLRDRSEKLIQSTKAVVAQSMKLLQKSRHLVDDYRARRFQSR
jgi:hypothetical protein